MTNQRVVLITGASSGIGKATVEKFARQGWRVAATMRDPARAPAFDAPIDNIAVIALDVTKSDTITAAFADIAQRWGAIDIVINNAGYGLVGPFEMTSDQDIRRQIETNVFGVMAVTRAALPAMRARKSGMIIFVASMGGRLTFPYYSIYHATKWAVEGFSESLRFELMPWNIGVKIIEPGAIHTEFYGRSESGPRDAALGAYKSHFNRIYTRMSSVGKRAPGPELVADAIWRAATDGSSKIRYTPNAGLILLLRRLFGDRLFARGVKRALRV